MSIQTESTRCFKESGEQSLFHVREIGKMSMQIISSITTSPIPRADAYKLVEVLS